MNLWNVEFMKSSISEDFTKLLWSLADKMFTRHADKNQEQKYRVEK